ncbi:MAG TPA: YggT family protein [Anaerolineales bacterium]|nr:YggT family protein [Anaerolineae bacterium]HIQ02480.1 YggT family protein [Anaerolineales bacterium]
MTYFLYRLIRTLFTLYTLALIARAVLPLLGMSYAHPVMRFLWDITEPLLAPIRRRLPPTGPFDFSPLVLILILWLIEQILLWVLL